MCYNSLVFLHPSYLQRSSWKTEKLFLFNYCGVCTGGTLGRWKKNHTSHQHLIYNFILIYYFFLMQQRVEGCHLIHLLAMLVMLLFFFYLPQLKTKYPPHPPRPIIGPALPPGFKKPSQDTGNNRCSIGPSVSSDFHTQVCESRSLSL